ncbi:carboxylating nicotinate-nucleotide diphosphorylase [Tunicatimonas pelagia]|uniref:carboxylating nicotinate-nucleotide diphosphorylase n=1 Tax=Tunicatimonas pelagia TaxID=931531 RepID=UPI0026671C8C|nr:carboxylating nicotinate-nucleotide diphosphorylase [Tunicatimonas pelagia]WKN43762.1 carboxylating nicotinate-nucleotide diphosphorylase [Tunicatimonas pelagia]
MDLSYLTPERIQQFIQSALVEDIGEGDHSTLASVPADLKKQARLLVKGEGIIAGVQLAEHIFSAVDEQLSLDVAIADGSSVQFGDVALVVTGKAQSILSAERLVLNCMQRMSGIATYTHQLQSLINHTKAKLLDTRKTTPNFRLPEKWAVAIGGGQNHRYALYDMVMLKDNHIDYAGGIQQAVSQTHQYLQDKNLKLEIEVETRNLVEVQQALEVGGIDVIMLDNMTPEQMKEAVDIIGNRAKTEASGNINETTIVEVAECGVDYISVGALTHSVKSLDMSLKAIQ